MSKAVLIASGYCDAAVGNKRPVSEIMTHLEDLFEIGGDEPVLLTKVDHQEIWLVFDDSRPNELIYKLPKGYGNV